MNGELRADLTGADKAVSEVLDEVQHRMHGLISGGSYHREFLDWLGERGYVVVRGEEAAMTAQKGDTAKVVMTGRIDHVEDGRMRVRLEGFEFDYGEPVVWVPGPAGDQS